MGCGDDNIPSGYGRNATGARHVELTRRDALAIGYGDGHFRKHNVIGFGRVHEGPA
jgi:hypothetical protein